MTAPDRFPRPLLARITNMSTQIERALAYLASRNPQTTAELGFLPTEWPSLLVWVVWLLFACAEL